MTIIVSGEGKSDIGYVYNGNFIPGPIYYIIDKMLEKKLSYSIYNTCRENIRYIHKSELSEYAKKFTYFAGKKHKKGTAYFFKNARALAIISKDIRARTSSEVISFFFRDADGTNSSPSSLWLDKYSSIKSGFLCENFLIGVPMLPMPKSEAWLLYLLEPQNTRKSCDYYENLPGNDNAPLSAKILLDKKLSSLCKNYYDISSLICDESVDIENTNLTSFDKFKIDFEESYNNLKT